jgi:hypothetical protein
MLPFALALAESDVTLRAGADIAYVESATELATSSIMQALNAELRGRSISQGGMYSFSLGGTYARLSELTIGGGSAPATNNFAGTAGGHLAWYVSPGTQIFLDSTGFAANRLAIRAENLLAARDPFLQDRVEYALDTQLGWSEMIARSTVLRMTGGYVGAGGLASSEAEAVGPDLHGAKASLSATHEITTRDYVIPELRFTYTHYYHALLDTALDRGPYSVATGTAALGVTHVLSRRLLAGVTGGATVATPPPILGSTKPIVAPEARVQVTYGSSRYRALASYSYAYTSLGPRIGFGQVHTGTLELRLRPLAGSAWRDVELRGIGNVAYGSAPVAEALLTLPTGALPPDETGKITTFTVAAGAHLDVPIVKGVLFTSGFDLEFVHASLDPPPQFGNPGPMLMQVMSVGIVAILSTDRRELYRRDPDADADAERGGAPVDRDVDATMMGRPQPGAPRPTEDAAPPPAPIDRGTYLPVPIDRNLEQAPPNGRTP